MMLMIAACTQTTRQESEKTDTTQTQDVKPLDEVIDTEPLVDEKENIVEAPQTEDDKTPITPQKTEKYTSGPLTDYMYEYNYRRYYYTEDKFGVASDADYSGPAPRMMSDKSFTMRVFNIVYTPEKKIDIEINYDSDTYEATGLMGKGDIYVTRDGVKIFIEEIYTNKFDFTLSSVPESEHTELCPECAKIADERADDGVRYVTANERKVYMFAGKEYKFSIFSFDREKNTVRLQVNSQVLPQLLPGQEYTLFDGAGLKFLFAAAHDADKLDNYGYAAFGFINSKDIPVEAMCPDCTDFVFIPDGETQKFAYQNLDHLMTVKDDKGVKTLMYDASDSTRLILNTMMPLTEDISAVLLSTEPQNKIGLIVKGGINSKVSCSPVSEMNTAKKGEIKVEIGKEENRFEREDYCLDENTLVDYSCKMIEGREHYTTGAGWTAVKNIVKCTCRDGACA